MYVCVQTQHEEHLYIDMCFRLQQHGDITTVDSATEWKIVELKQKKQILIQSDIKWADAPPAVVTTVVDNAIVVTVHVATMVGTVVAVAVVVIIYLTVDNDAAVAAAASAVAASVLTIIAIVVAA
jgi:hypothetical protein